MANQLRITTSCYSQRLEEIRIQLIMLEEQVNTGSFSEDLESLLHQQIKGLYASLWALHAETEED